MRILMLSTQRGCPDRITVLTYAEGQEYDPPADLAEVFIREGWAVSNEMPPTVVEETAVPRETEQAKPKRGRK
jgi:hypothetical protein